MHRVLCTQCAKYVPLPRKKTGGYDRLKGRVPSHDIISPCLSPCFSSHRTLSPAGCVPLVVGGTGLYILTLLQGGPTGSPQSTTETKAMVARLVEEEDGGSWEKRSVDNTIFT